MLAIQRLEGGEVIDLVYFALVRQYFIEMFRIALVAGNIEEMEGMEQGQPRSYKPFPCRDFVVSTSANNTKRDSMAPRQYWFHVPYGVHRKSESAS